MHPQDSSERKSSPPSGRDRDPQQVYEGGQRMLLGRLLEEFPGLLTYHEALVAQVEEPDNPMRADDFDWVVRALRENGLVVREGVLLMASRAARAMVELGYQLG